MLEADELTIFFAFFQSNFQFTSTLRVTYPTRPLRLVTRVALVAENLFKGFCNLATGEFRKGAGQFFYGTGRNIFMLLPDALYGIYLIFTGIHFNVHGATVKSEISVRWGALDPIGRGEQRTTEMLANAKAQREQQAEAVEKARANELALIEKGERGECTGAEYFTLAMMYNGGSCTTTAPDQNKYWEYVVKASEAGYSRAMELVGAKKLRDQQAEASAAAEARAKAAAEARAKAAAEARAKAAAEQKAAREVSEYRRLSQIADQNPQCDPKVWFQLGTMTANGIGTPKNSELAEAFFRNAVERGQEIERCIAAAEKEIEELKANILVHRANEYLVLCKL